MAVLCRLSYSSVQHMIGLRLQPRPLILAVLLLTACGGADRGGSGEATLTLHGDRGPVRLQVDIAESPEERTRGLMGVERLGELEGMVFLLDQPTRSSFTMRNTLIPLSLGVWGPDGRLEAIVDMDPCRKEPCPLYDPGVAWVGAVEVNQGVFAERGIAVGDRVRLER